MNNDNLNTYSQMTIAYCTFVGVGGALAYYIDTVLNAPIGYIIFSEIVYILIWIIVIKSFGRK